MSKQNLGCSLVATFGTETTKSAILTACRGYRSEEYPDGIDVDTAQYLSSLAPSERGFLWPLKDIVNGNPDKDRKPITSFIKEVNKYPGLLDIMTNIEDEKINSIASFNYSLFIESMKNDFDDIRKQNYYYFDETMAKDYIDKSTDISLKLINKLNNDINPFDSTLYRW